MTILELTEGQFEKAKGQGSKEGLRYKVKGQSFDVAYRLKADLRQER